MIDYTKVVQFSGRTVNFNHLCWGKPCDGSGGSGGSGGDDAHDYLKDAESRVKALQAIRETAAHPDHSEDDIRRAIQHVGSKMTAKEAKEAAEKVGIFGAKSKKDMLAKLEKSSLSIKGSYQRANMIDRPIGKQAQHDKDKAWLESLPHFKEHLPLARRVIEGSKNA